MKKKKIIIMLCIIIAAIICTNKVNAMTIVLDPGHGGIDCGALSNDKKINERDVNLKIAQYLKTYLEQYNDVTVYLTHNGFTSGELEIYDRAMIARNKKADLFISLHINSSSSGSPQGAEVYVTANKSLPKYNQETTKLGNIILTNLGKLGIKSRGVQTRLITRDKTDIYSDGTTADYYGVIRYAMRGTKIDNGVVKPAGAVSANIQNGEGVPTVLIEHCYINSSDIQFIDSDGDINKIAQADGDAIAEYYSLKKKNSTTNPTELMYGDANLDGNINSGDLLFVRKYLLGKLEVKDEKQLKVMDPNRDGTINSGDLLVIRKHLLGTINIESYGGTGR